MHPSRALREINLVKTTGLGRPLPLFFPLSLFSLSFSPDASPILWIFRPFYTTPRRECERRGRRVEMRLPMGNKEQNREREGGREREKEGMFRALLSHGLPESMGWNWGNFWPDLEPFFYRAWPSPFSWTKILGTWVQLSMNKPSYPAGRGPEGALSRLKTE